LVLELEHLKIETRLISESVVTMAQKIEKKICSTSKKYGTGNQSVVQGGGKKVRGPKRFARVPQ